MRKKVLFKNKTNNEFYLIITDAPKEAIEYYCRYHNQMFKDGIRFELFSTLKAQYYVKELLNSQVDDFEDVDIIGYDVCYDFGQYTKISERIPGFRTIKFTAGMTQEFEVISTNAPNSVIKANMYYIEACEESGASIDNPYAVIEGMGYRVNLIGCQDDFDSEDIKNAIIDAEFDYYNFHDTKKTSENCTIMNEA